MYMFPRFIIAHPLRIVVKVLLFQEGLNENIKTAKFRLVKTFLKRDKPFVSFSR